MRKEGPPIEAFAMNAMNSTWRPGMCAVTEVEPFYFAHCHDRSKTKGSFKLKTRRERGKMLDVRACLEACSSCDRCVYLSVSDIDGDCSWYSECGASTSASGDGGELLNSCMRHQTARVRQKPGDELKVQPLLHSYTAHRRRARGRAEVFSNIYRSDCWFSDGGGSGRGSTLENAAGAARVIFHVMLHYKLSSLVDAPCGAMVWQRPLIAHLRQLVPTFRFLGVDVAHGVVAANRDRFAASKSHITFEQADLAVAGTKLSEGYDLLLSRDALQHNTIQDVWGMLATFALSHVTYLLIGTYPHTKWNADITTGEMSHYNLEAEPFGLRPLAVYSEGYDKKHLALFRREELQRAVCNGTKSSSGAQQCPSRSTTRGN